MTADPARHYATLGVSPSVSAKELRAAYLQLARRHHPDRLADRSAAEQRAAASMMARINEAWAVLGDDRRRAAYDHTFDAPSRATIRDVDHEFVALDDEDWVDPRLLDDTPSGPGLSRRVTFLPAALAAAGVVLLFSGWFFAFGGLVSVGLVVLVASAAAFVLIPLAVMIDSSRSDPLD